MNTASDIWNSLAPGTVWRGTACGDHAPAFPLFAARGEGDGPSLLLVGGVHGDEYEGTAAIWRFFRAIDVGRIKGRVTAIPVANVCAWQAQTRQGSPDGVDMNRVFGKGGDAGPTARVADFIFERLVRPADVVLDFHSGGIRMSHLPICGWYEGDRAAECIARQFGPAFHPWRIPPAEGVLSYEARRIGKIALGLEWKGGGRVDPAGVSAYVAGIFRVLDLIAGMGSGAACRRDPAIGFPPDERTPMAGGYLTAGVSGLFIPQTALGCALRKGDIIGAIHAANGDPLQQLAADHDGMVAALPHQAYVRAGDRIAYLG